MLGKILDIDLTTETWELAEYPQDLARKYLGGRGFNMHVLYHQLPANANPLGPVITSYSIHYTKLYDSSACF